MLRLTGKHNTNDANILVCRFAFVEFDTEAAAAAAIEEHNNEEVDGRELHVSHAAAAGKQTPHKSQGLYSATVLEVALSLIHI